MSKTYELSISKQYVSNWSVSDAIREILQNAIDSEKNGCKKHIEYDYENEILSISNDGAKLDKNTLVLGCGNKTNNKAMIGGFSEGYKLAMVVLIRNGHNIKILNDDRKWIPEFLYSHMYDVETLHVNENKMEKRNRLEFIIDNINITIYRELCNNFPCIENDFGKVVECHTGQLLLDKKHVGRMYVEGLYVQTDTEFEFGYNFNADVVKLDRDRKAINYYSLKKLTARAVMTAKELDDVIYKKIKKGGADVSYIQDEIKHLDEEFAKMFTVRFMEENNIDNEVIIVSDNQVAKQLESQGKSVVIGNKYIESITNEYDTNKKNIIRLAKEEIRNKNNTTEAWEDFEDSLYRKLLQFGEMVKETIMAKETISSSQYMWFVNNILNKCDKPYKFEYIEERVLENVKECTSDEFLNNL